MSKRSKVPPTLRALYTKRQSKVNAVMMPMIQLALKAMKQCRSRIELQIESLDNEIATHFGANLLFSVRAVSLASSQS